MNRSTNHTDDLLRFAFNVREKVRLMSDEEARGFAKVNHIRAGRGTEVVKRNIFLWFESRYVSINKAYTKQYKKRKTKQ